jgi:hypothetical protein
MLYQCVACGPASTDPNPVIPCQQSLVASIRRFAGPQFRLTPSRDPIAGPLKSSEVATRIAAIAVERKRADDHELHGAS